MRWEAAGLVTLIVGQGGNAPMVDAVDGARTTPSGHRVELLGICDLTSSGAVCWDRNGRTNSDLQTRVLDLFKKKTTGDVNYRRGAKNRFLVLNMGKGTSFALTGSGGSSLSVVGQEPLQLHRLVLDPDVQRFDTYVQVNNATELPPAILRFATGETLDYGGCRLEIGMIEDAKSALSPYGYGTSTSRTWRIFLGEGRPEGATQIFRYEALDARGEPIWWVDANGKKISEQEYRASLIDSQVPDVKVSSRGFSEGRIGTSNGFGWPIGGQIFTNIDPAHIKSLRVIGWSPERIRFSDLPADPASVSAGGVR